MAIPKELKTYHQWVTYRGIDDKAPRQINDDLASSTDASTWDTWDSVVDLEHKGFVLSTYDPFIFWDFDKCLDEEGNITDKQIEVIVDKLDSYTEVSPSKKGLHVLCIAKLPDVGGNRKGKVEVYDQSRYTTMTGDIYKGRDIIEERQSIVNSIHRVIWKDKYKEDEDIEVRPTQDTVLPDDVVLEGLFDKDKNAEKWKIVFHGGWQAYYTSQSEADMAIMHKLAFYTQNNKAQMDNIFRMSGLMRDKFNRDDYRNGLIESSLGSEIYTPKKKDVPLDPETITDRYTFKPFPDLMANPPPPRQHILFPIVPEKSITLISGETGAGKTMFCMGLADALGKGEGFGPWENEDEYKVCLIDGEMPIEELHERAVQMELNTNVVYYSKSELWEKDRMSDGNMIDPEWQVRMLFSLMEQEVKVVIIDNVSSLAPGIDESSKKDWDDINQWLLSLRHAGITVILVHHMGKSGEGQRGTSGRVDNVDTVLEINFPSAYNPEVDMCKVIS